MMIGAIHSIVQKQEVLNAEPNPVQDQVKNSRTISTTSDLSSVDLCIQGYRSFPIDDDIFGEVPPQRKSVLYDLGTRSSSDAGSQKSADNASRNSRQYIRILERQSAIAWDQSDPNSSAFSTSEIQVIDGELASISEKHNSDGSSSSQSNRRSYYVPGDEITPDNVSNGSSISTTGSNDANTHCRITNTLMPHIHTHEVRREIGAEGGVLEIPGCGVSVHILPTKACVSSSQRKQSRNSSSSAVEGLDIKMDRRVILALDDVPSDVNNSTRIAVGSMVCLEYGHLDILSSGIVLQIETNASLKQLNQNYHSVCKFGCIITSSLAGPCQEIITDCYHYGNTLQILISKDDIASVISDAGASLFMIPVVMMVNDHVKPTDFCVWDGISSMSVWVAVFGPKRSQMCNSCCISISSSTTCPPILTISKNNKPLSLHLWAAYRTNIHCLQDIQVSLKRDPHSCVSIFPNNTVIEADDVLLSTRINKLIALKYLKEAKTLDRRESGADEAAIRERKNERFLLSLVGLKSHVTILEATFDAPIRSPPWSTSVRRWKRNSKVVPRPLSSCHGPQRYLYLWFDAQREETRKLKPTFVIPGADRRVAVPRVAVAVTARLRGKKKKTKMPLLLDYQQSDIMPLLTNTTIWMHGTLRYKEWYVGYLKGRIGLIHTQCVRIYDSNKCLDKGHENLNVSELIDCLTDPVGELASCFNMVKTRLLDTTIDWVLFSSILGFAENYISRVAKDMDDDSTKDIRDKLTLFLDKFSEFCETANHGQSIHGRIIRALLLMQEHALASSLLTDNCILTVSQKIGRRFQELQNIMDDTHHDKFSSTARSYPLRKSAETLPEMTNNKEITNAAFEWLCIQREKWWSGNDEGFVMCLHQSVARMPETPIRRWTHFTSALILILSAKSIFS